MAGMESVPNWSAFISPLVLAAIKLIADVEFDVREFLSSCKREIFSRMPVLEGRICENNLRDSCETEGENKLQRSKTQPNKMAVPDWSGLLPDLLEEISKQLSLIKDFTAFRGVCTSWRAAVAKGEFSPLLMLSEKYGDGDVREFYSLCKRKIVMRIPMPEAKGKKCLGARFGWYLTVASSGGELNLVKPLSSSKIQLPNMMTFPEYDEYFTKPEWIFVDNVALSANPSETSDFVLMVVVNMNLGFWRNGDNCWTKLELLPPRGRAFANIGCYKHKMYVTDFYGNVWMWDPNHLTAPEILLTLPESWLPYMQLAYMVESSKGELLLITRRSLHKGTRICIGIIQIDTEKRTYSRITDLDQDAIFIGLNNAVSIVADDFPGVVTANCIYFADLGIYNVEDESIERFDVESSSSICPPLWIFPSQLDHVLYYDVQ